MLALAAATAVTAPGAGTASAVSAAEPCTSAASATFRHTFSGISGKTTISSVRPLCAGQKQAFALVAYTAGSGNRGQFVYSTDRKTITSTNRTVNLDVVVPPCRATVDAVLGAELLDEAATPESPYGSRTLGAPGSRSAGPLAHYRGGSVDCAPAPTVTFVNACDGTFTATLANATSANVSAVFLVSGRLTRLAPGRSTRVDGPRGGSLTIRDSNFTSYVGTWRPPASGCDSAAPPPPSAPAVLPTTPLSATTSPSAPVPSAPSTVTTMDPPAVGYPAPEDTSESLVAVAKKNMSIGSVIAIAFGLVLIGGGIILLVRVLRSLREPS
ncbi:hypothetical protein [Paractinoplanes brasiliensis]|uniref:Uncharacterized protein n=1 Tax=Paractinoplanes brasiliensis TaxID=52695 RepID=A0A4R6JN92_9ACTN|nr:hypothetical protein [Actinoplanes brasiliensis]TDO37830.1 hypothetical protein C8E87_1465 [Actinoplanes brasiliensis]GID32171.1 hypothetical protein Abr02nite_71540 [Actinoplanes brasiliensis]